jgi:hypothetical protein
VEATQPAVGRRHNHNARIKSNVLRKDTKDRQGTMDARDQSRFLDWCLGFPWVSMSIRRANAGGFGYYGCLPTLSLGPVPSESDLSDLLQVFGDKKCALKDLYMSVDAFRSVDTMERVLKAACQVPSLNYLEILIRTESGESGLRALARVLPHTTHLREFRASYFTGHHRIWPDYVLEELRGGFMQNTSITKLDLMPELLTESVPSMFAARLHHQILFVCPSLALLPHLMKQEGLDVGGVNRRNSMQTSIFMTLKTHASLVCGCIEQQKTNGKVNPKRCKQTRVERNKVKREWAKRKKTERKKAKRKAST